MTESTFKSIGAIAAQIVADLRVRRAALVVRSLPERVFLEFIGETIADPRSEAVRDRLNRYAALSPEALAAVGADKAPPIPLYAPKVPT